VKSKQRVIEYAKMLLTDVNFKNFIHVSAAYLKLLFSLLNSNQQENLILKIDMFSDYYSIFIILTNID
jgi:hypothetical protein